MNVDDLRTQFHDLVVTACEWRAMGLADPHDMAAEVFSRLARRFLGPEAAVQARRETVTEG